MTATLELRDQAAAQLRAMIEHRTAMSKLLEPNLERAEAPKAKPKVERFLVADDEFDLIQDTAESDFFQEQVEGMQHRMGRSARQAW